jgi:hypothetical protein
MEKFPKKIVEEKMTKLDGNPKKIHWNQHLEIIPTCRVHQPTQQYPCFYIMKIRLDPTKVEKFIQTRLGNA